MEMVGGCCVCLDERGWDENPLVYCDGDGCNVAVHQACYGIVKVPSGPWFCCKCRSTERVARVKCELCPFKEGALKRTDNGGWAHVVCALYIPEVRFGNVTTMEPIKMSSVPQERFHKTCYICEEAGRESKTSNGACMSCNKPGCKQNFHVTCAQTKRMLCEEAGHYGNVQYVGYCGQHWAKKSGSRNGTVANTEHEKKQKEKKRNRHDSVSSGDANKTKKKEKLQNPSKSISSSNAPEKNEKALEKALPSLAKAEKSAAESLNLLQQMPGILNYFPNGTGPKTPLNSLISSNEQSSNASNFNMANILNSQQNSENRSSPNAEEFIDVVDTRKTPDPTFQGVDKAGKGSDYHKTDGKHKISSTNSERASDSTGKMSSHHKKVTSGHHKGASHSSKAVAVDSKKRKSVAVDGEKSVKKKKVEEKRKVRKKLQKAIDIGIPRPSKTDLFENDRIPSLFPRNFGDKNPESFQDLLEFQWNKGAQFLIQKANHYDVGSLLSCLYQLRAENEDLEKRLEQLSARRDRLIAATTRLSTPFVPPTNSDKPVPLSAMLAKLKSEPNEGTSSDNKQTSARGIPNDSQTNNSALQSRFSSSFDGREAHSKENHETTVEDLNCKETMSEENSLSGTPTKDVKRQKTSKKDSKFDSKDGEGIQNGAKLQSTLVQPPIVKPCDTDIVGSITASHLPQNPAGFIHQAMRQHQQQPGLPSSNLVDLMSVQPNVLGNFKPEDKS